MIIPVLAHHWHTHSQKFAEVALREGHLLFTKDAEGGFQRLPSTEGVTPTTALFLEIADFFDLYTLAQHFDLMVKEFGKEGVCLALDCKGGGFKQR